MIRLLFAGALLLVGSRAAFAQQRDTTTRRDTTTHADSAARTDSIARADSIALVRELERIAGEPHNQVRQDTAPPPAAPVNSRLLPSISVVGDMVADLSPDGSTQESAQRLGIREVEVAFQAAVDPYFRADVYLGVHDGGAAIEQAFLTATALPWGLEARLGRFLMPIGKQNLTHRHDLHTLDHSYVVQRFLGEEGLKGTGVSVSRIFAPFGFYQELQLGAVETLAGGGHEAHGAEGEEEHAAEPAEPASRRFGGLGYVARFRNYWDLSRASNIELSFSGATGRRAQPIACADASGTEQPCPDGASGVNVRQSLVGADITFRWRPPARALYRSFIFQAEVFRQLNEGVPLILDFDGGAGTVFPVYEGPTRDFDGAYAFARVQTTRRTFVGARVDWLQDPEADGATYRAASGYLQFFPSEFSKLLLAYERTLPSAAHRAVQQALGASGEGVHRIVLQATFAIGPHKPHPF